MMSDKKMMRVTQIRSSNGRLESHRACIRGLGLRRINHAVVIEDTSATRGMTKKVYYMVRVEEI